MTAHGHVDRRTPAATSIALQLPYEARTQPYAVPGADDAKNLRNLVRQMAIDTLPEGEREQGRIEVLPVQWRKHLNLGVRAALCLLTETLRVRSQTRLESPDVTEVSAASNCRNRLGR